MSLLKNLTSDSKIADEKDSVGSTLLDSNLYPAKVKLVYVTKSASGAIGLVVHLPTDNGKEVRETLWMSSGTAKGGKNYYEKDGEKRYLPGYLMATALSLLTVGKEVSDLDTETKVVNVYNPELKKEVPTKVEVPVELLNQEIYVGVIRERVDKTAKNDDGVYAPTGETREQNVIDKFFRASDKMTTTEIRAEAEEAKFFETWQKKWVDQVRDRTSKEGQGAAAKTKAASQSNKPTTSLFAA